MSFSKKTLGILFGVFLLSVIVRLPNLNRPLSKHHEFVTGVSLLPMQIFSMEGAATYNFSPVMSYPNKADKHIKNHASRLKDAEGNYYYISHPPLAYLLPHFTFTLLNIKPTALALQLFNLLFHFITALFVFKITELMLKQLNLQIRQAVFNQAIITYPVDLEDKKIEEWRLKLRTN